MSLTRFIRKPEINDKLNALLRDAELGRISLPDAPAPEGRNDLVGIGYDYFLRFYLQRFCKVYYESKLVAEKVLHILGPPEIETLYDDGHWEYEENKFTIYAKDLYAQISNYRKEYCAKGKIEEAFIVSILKLSQLDLIFRGGKFVGRFYDIKKEEIEDLKHLIALTKADIFKVKNYIICNPRFGKASQKVGGADGDLIIDNKLIEIKTVKSTSKWKEYLKQLIGYYLLLEIGGLDEVDMKVKVDVLSLYFARHTKIVDFPVESIFGANENINNYINWFSDQIERN